MSADDAAGTGVTSLDPLDDPPTADDPGTIDPGDLEGAPDDFGTGDASPTVTGGTCAAAGVDVTSLGALALLVVRRRVRRAGG